MNKKVIVKWIWQSILTDWVFGLLLFVCQWRMPMLAWLADKAGVAERDLFERWVLIYIVAKGKGWINLNHDFDFFRVLDGRQARPFFIRRYLNDRVEIRPVEYQKLWWMVNNGCEGYDETINQLDQSVRPYLEVTTDKPLHDLRWTIITLEHYAGKEKDKLILLEAAEDAIIRQVNQDRLLAFCNDLGGQARNRLLLAYALEMKPVWLESWIKLLQALSVADNSCGKMVFYEIFQAIEPLFFGANPELDLENACHMANTIGYWAKKDDRRMEEVVNRFLEVFDHVFQAVTNVFIVARATHNTWLRRRLVEACLSAGNVQQKPEIFLLMELFPRDYIGREELIAKIRSDLPFRFTQTEDQFLSSKK